MTLVKRISLKGKLVGPPVRVRRMKVGPVHMGHSHVRMEQAPPGRPNNSLRPTLPFLLPVFLFSWVKYKYLSLLISYRHWSWLGIHDFQSTGMGRIGESQSTLFLSHHVLLICIRLLVKIHDRIFRFSYDLPFIITGKDL